jgi:hypothetical protein
LLAGVTLGAYLLPAAIGDSSLALRPKAGLRIGNLNALFRCQELTILRRLLT